MQTIQTMRSSRPVVAQSQRVAAANRPTCRTLLPARVRNVHAQVISRAEVTTPERSAVQQMVQTGTSVQQDASVSLKDKVASFIQTTAKAAAVLGVAMALVSVVVNRWTATCGTSHICVVTQDRCICCLKSFTYQCFALYKGSSMSLHARRLKALSVSFLDALSACQAVCHITPLTLIFGISGVDVYL